MAINPSGPISTPIVTFASPGQRKAVGQENEEDKARPLPPVEEGQQSEASANRKRDPNRIEDELPDQKRQNQQSPSDKSTSDLEPDAEQAQDSEPFQAVPSQVAMPLQPQTPIAIDDMLALAAKGLKFKDSEGDK